MDSITAQLDGISWGIWDLDNVLFPDRFVAGNGMFLGLRNNQLMRSTDGIHWGDCGPNSSDETSWQSAYLSGPKAWLNAISYGNNEFVGITSSGIILRSTDGEVWTTARSFGLWFVQALADGNGHFVGVGDRGAILQSGEIVTLKPVAAPPGNPVQLEVTGQAGHAYQIQTSPNLADWLTLTNLTLGDTTVRFTDPTLSNPTGRFYRVVAS